MGTSILHIKTEVECKVFLFDEEKGVATPGKYFNIEVRKGKQDLLFVNTSDEDLYCDMIYQIEENDADYNVAINEAMFHTLTEVSYDELINAVYDEDDARYSRDGKYLISFGNYDIEEYTVKPTCKVICDQAFSGCNYITSIRLPEGLTHIGNGAFSDCWNLVNINLPNSLIYIGDGAFSSCLSAYITLPINLKHVGRGAIDSRIKHVRSNSPTFAIHDNCLIDNKEKRLIVYLSDDQNVIIPANITQIGDYAFLDHKNLSSVIFPEDLESIGDYAFAYCEKLSLVKFSYGLKYIGNNSFDGCSNLIDIKLPQSLSYIGNKSFWNCQRLTHINISPQLKHIGDEAFTLTGINTVDCYSPYYIYTNDCLIDKENKKLITCLSKKQEINLVAGITIIGKSAFYGSEITSIKIPDGVTHIDDFAFKDCKNLSNVVLPNSLISIGNGAFGGCYNLSCIKLPASLKRIGANAFTVEEQMDSGLRSIYLQLFEKYGVPEGESLVFEPISSIIIPQGTRSHFESLIPSCLHKKLKEDNRVEYVKTF